jgi:hypothetical protein
MMFNSDDQVRLHVIDKKIGGDLEERLGFFEQLAQSQISPEDVVSARI